MKIAIDARFYGPVGAGIGRYLEKLIENLEEIDQDNEYFVLLRKENLDEYRPKNRNFKKILAPYPWYSFKEQFFLPLLLYKLKPDLVHFPHFNVPILYFGRFVVTIHDLIITRFDTTFASTRYWLVYKIKRLFYHLVIRNAVQRAKAILAVSNYTKSELLKFFNLRNKKIVVTYEGAEFNFGKIVPQARKEMLKRYHIKAPFFLYVGHAYPHKNLENMVLAFKKIAASRDNLQLVLVGKIDFFYQYLKQKVSTLNLTDRIIFTDIVPDEVLVAFYEEALSYVFPSLCEGFGLPGLEAMACGCPVLASEAGSLPEIYGEAALFFNPRDIDDVAGKMQMIIDDEDLRKELCQKGLAQVKKYSWQRCAKETLKLYQSVK